MWRHGLDGAGLGKGQVAGTGECGNKSLHSLNRGIVIYMRDKDQQDAHFS